MSNVFDIARIQFVLVFIILHVCRSYLCVTIHVQVIQVMQFCSDKILVQTKPIRRNAMEGKHRRMVPGYCFLT